MRRDNIFLFQEAISIHAAYGSSRDIHIFTSLGLAKEQIFIVGKQQKNRDASNFQVGFPCFTPIELTSNGHSMKQTTNEFYISTRSERFHWTDQTVGWKNLHV